MNIQKARMNRGFGSNMSIDLHMHSVYSDGVWTPAELVKSAKEKQLSAIALTDHDTIAGLQETRVLAELSGIRFVNGVEINSHYYLNSFSFQFLFHQETLFLTHLIFKFPYHLYIFLFLYIP